MLKNWWTVASPYARDALFHRSSLSHLVYFTTKTTSVFGRPQASAFLLPTRNAKCPHLPILVSVLFSISHGVSERNSSDMVVVVRHVSFGFSNWCIDVNSKGRCGWPELDEETERRFGMIRRKKERCIPCIQNV